VVKSKKFPVPLYKMSISILLKNSYLNYLDDFVNNIIKIKRINLELKKRRFYIQVFNNNKYYEHKLS